MDNAATLKSLGHINVENLHVEIATMAAVYATEAEKMLTAMRVLAEAKESRLLTAALIDADARKTAQTSGAKVTEKMIESVVLSDETYRDRAAAELEAELALEHAKYALKVLERKERALDLMARSAISENRIITRTT